MLDDIGNLEELWKVVERINIENFPDNNLAPICGNGRLSSPKLMFVFINPTHVNSSSDKLWNGPRFPFCGTKAFWRVLHNAGMFDDSLMEKIENSREWSYEFSQNILDFLDSSSIYMTNIVKYTGDDASLPDYKKIDLFLPVLEKEIEIVQPDYIITFGLIPFENLTRQKIKLGDYHSRVMERGNLEFFKKRFGSHNTKIIPCYFPVGRGNPKKSSEILALVKSL